MISRPPFRVLAVGGAHVDRRGRLAQAFVPGASNPGVMLEEVGGGVFNALRTIRRRGGHATLLSVRGGDAAGEAVARAIAEAGITDLSAVFLDRSTPTYTAILDHEGELLAGLADMGLYESAFPRQLARSQARDAVAAADAVLCDANLPAPALERLAAAAGETPLHAIAISPAKVTRLRGIAARLSCLFLNRREAAAFSGCPAAAPAADIAAALRAAGARRAVVTAGAGALMAIEDGAVYEADPPPPAAIGDVTGAGDSLAGAIVAALAGGEAFVPALREGLAAAKLCVESFATAPEHDPAAFAQALASVTSPRRVA